jgi:hypothetical protein
LPAGPVSRPRCRWTGRSANRLSPLPAPRPASRSSCRWLYYADVNPMTAYFAGWHRAMIWPWGRPSHRTPLPAAPPVLVRKESFLGPGCSSGSGWRRGSPWGVGPAERREDGLAAVVDQCGGAGAARRMVAVGAGRALSAAVLALGARRAEPDGPGSAVVRPLTAAPEPDGWAIDHRAAAEGPCAAGRPSLAGGR